MSCQDYGGSFSLASLFSLCVSHSSRAQKLAWAFWRKALHIVSFLRVLPDMSTSWRIKPEFIGIVFKTLQGQAPLSSLMLASNTFSFEAELKSHLCYKAFLEPLHQEQLVLPVCSTVLVGVCLFHVVLCLIWGSVFLPGSRLHMARVGLSHLSISEMTQSRAAGHARGSLTFTHLLPFDCSYLAEPHLKCPCLGSNCFCPSNPCIESFWVYE